VIHVDWNRVGQLLRADAMLPGKVLDNGTSVIAPGLTIRIPLTTQAAP